MQTQRIIVNGILPNNRKVLVAKRSQKKKIAPGRYHLPGGHVEFGEEPANALVREFDEEFGLTVKVEDVVRTFCYVIGDTHTIGLTFLISTNDDLKNIEVDRDDNERIDWITAAHLSDYFESGDHDFITLSSYYGN